MAIANLVILLALGADPASVEPDRAGYQKSVAPFFKSYCDKCHSGAKPESEFSLQPSKLQNDFSDPAVRAKWREVVNVLNSHEMPPEKEKQPGPDEVAAVVDWITAQTVRAELSKRERTVVLRRLNRAEYHNTIRDLIGVDFDTSGFPQDPPAGGFDNNGGALTISPLHMEMYLAAAQQILDRALVEGDRPASIRWRFEPKAGAMDRTRLRLDAKNNPLVNGNNNQQEGAWVVVHHNSWDKSIGARDFRVPTAGQYAIRIHAAGRVPSRDQVIESASKILKHRQDEQDEKNPKGKEWTQRQFDQDLKHFQTDRMYDYGPPRVKLTLQLGPQPRTITEFDVDGSPDKPKVFEFITRFTTESAGISIEYAYAIPAVLENFWMQSHQSFARPELMVDWFEVEGPLYDAWPPSTHSKILHDSPVSKSDETRYVREVLSKFMRKAYRRPIDASEVELKLKLFVAARKEKSLVEAIKAPLTAILASPHFLYLAEPAPESAGKIARLDDHALASRMSYFLWSSMPDDELSQLAASGKLKDARTRIAQVDRMLAEFARRIVVDEHFDCQSH